MKRKPNKPRPEAQTHTEPGGGAAGPGGSAFEAGSEQEPGAAGTSGQSVPKSKFRQKSQQEQAAASKLRMEKRGEKREAAREKLAKQKPPKQKGPIRKAAGAAGWGVHGFVHGKLYEVEQENVGTEGAHRSELAGEVVLRHGSRFVKRKVREHPARAVSRAEAKYQKAAADYHFHTAAQEHPELSQNYFTRYWQKQRLRRQYQKRAKEAAKQGAKAAGKTAAATEKLTARAAGFVKRHPVGCLLALACVLVIVLLQSCSSSLVSIGNAGAGALGATTYPSEDEAILGAEAAYAGLEAELQTYLDTYESTHDYDEYHFDLDEIEHDPYVLISLLSALHEGEWTLSQVEGSLQMLFDRQYILTERVEVETRYALGEQQKGRVDPMYHEKIDGLIDRYAHKLVENINQSNLIDARVPSILIAGGSNFPVRKKEKQNAARDKNMGEYMQIEGLLDKVRSTGMGGISADDDRAMEKLETKLAGLEAMQEEMKTVNAYYRKHKTLEGCPVLSAEEIGKLQSSMASDWRKNPVPYPSYLLTNNNANIRRTRQRIEDLKSQSEYSGWAFPGGRAEINEGENRLQLFFEEKPSEEQRRELKSNGFKWAPSQGAWQRQLTKNAIYAAGRMEFLRPEDGQSPYQLQPFARKTEKDMTR